jgi:hypothetical protein
MQSIELQSVTNWRKATLDPRKAPTLFLFLA